MSAGRVAVAVPRTFSRFWIAVASCGLFTGIPVQPIKAEIQWRSVDAQALPVRDAAQVATTLRGLVPGDDTRRVVIQFAQTVAPADRARLSAAGVDLLAPLGNGAYFAAVSGSMLDTDRLGEIEALQAVQAQQTAFKQHPMIVRDEFPSYAIVGETTVDGQTQPVDQVAVYVLFHRDVAMGDGLAIAAEHEATVVSQLESVNGLVLELPRTEIGSLTDRDEVQWIEPPLPPFSTTNNSNRVITQANDVQAAPYNLDGTGVTVLVYDAGTGDSSHADFGGRLTVRDSSGLHSHSTHVAGTVGGDGTDSSGTYRGMAPGVTIEAYGFEWGGSGVFLYSEPGDIEDDYSEAISTFGVMIANNSIGTNTATNGFDCDITGDYGVTSNLIDTIVRGDASNPLFTEPFRIVWANGNERQTSRCGDLYNTTAPPATAKNHITVGALNSNDDSVTSFTSWGPTDDGRLKPDISAPGCQSNDDNAVTSCANGGGYTTACGTSMASPTVCGLSALLMEDFFNQFPGRPLFRNSTLKAWLAHSAFDGGNTGPDYQYGYGSVRIQAAIDLMRTGQFQEENISQGAVFSTSVVISFGDPELKVTLAWDDAPGTPNVNPNLVNDLDLVVKDPSSNQHYPWTLNPGNPSAAAVQTLEDHLNNIEQVLVNSPLPGTWTIEVVGTSVPDGPQPFSLVGDGASIVGTSIGFPNGLPTLLAPDVATPIDVTIASFGETLVPGSPTLHYRFDGGAFQSASLSFVGGNLYQATLPAAGCNDTPEFYFSAEGNTTGVVTQPSNAPASAFSAVVGEFAVLFSDNLETDQGWSISGSPAAGQWTRGVPIDCGRGDPPSDSDGSGQCWLTQNDDNGGDCNSDVDDGTAILTSPAYDMSGGGVISYAYWLNDIASGALGAEDSMTVEIATNAAGTNWQLLRTYDSAAGIWRTDSIDVEAEATASSTIRLRFSVSDLSPGDVVEGGVDAIEATVFQCDAAPVPSAPTGVSATDETLCDMVTVSWNSVIDADDYEVWRNTVDDSGSAAMIASGVVGTNYNDNAVPAGIHFYWVKACNTNGCSGFSASDAGSEDTAPSAPTGVSASDGLCDQVTVTWNATAGATGYEVWRNTVDNVGGAAQIGSPGGTSFIDNTAVPGTTYFYWVLATNACGAGAFSASNDGVADTVPSAVTGVSASDGSCDQITVNWDAAAGATGYEVWRNTIDNLGGAGQIGSPGGTSFVDNTALPGTTYYYWIRATNACGDGSFSSSDSGIADTAPSAPTGVSASDNTDCELITIQWDATGGTIGYEVYRNTVDDSGGAASIGSTAGTTFDDDTAAAGVTYFYWVVAQNTCGASGFGLSDDGVARQKGDFNGDGLINGLDIRGYVAASVTPPFFENCGDLAAPFGGTLDASDTSAFVTLLLAP